MKSVLQFLKSGVARNVLRWGVLVVGVLWICSQVTLRDRVNVVQSNGSVVSTALAAPAKETDNFFQIEGSSAPVGRDRVVSRPDRKTVEIRDPADPSKVAKVALLGIHLRGDINRDPSVDALIVANPSGDGGLRVGPNDVVGGFTLRTPRPVVEKGIGTMVREANGWLLLLSLAIFPITVGVTALRWELILRSQEIPLGFTQSLMLTLVGNFYNSFLPGSTGGDFVKAYQVSRQTPHKIRAMLSVFVDRVIGLFALVLLGGTMALYGFVTSGDGTIGEKLSQYSPLGSSGGLSPTAAACLNVTIGCMLIVVGAVVASVVVASKPLRRALGLNWLMRKLPMQHHLAKVREAAQLYKRHAFQIPWWIVLTLPVHIAVVLSALVAGQAFGLHIKPEYYFVCVPVMVLSAAIPISPQGAGVMEAIGFLLLAKQGATVSEVVALTLSIRFVQVLWNLVSGVAVLRGDYSKPKSSSLDAIADEEEPPEPEPVVA